MKGATHFIEVYRLPYADSNWQTFRPSSIWKGVHVLDETTIAIFYIREKTEQEKKDWINKLKN